MDTSKGLKDLSDKIDGLDDRLRKVENKIWWAIGAAVVVGAVFTALSQIVSFDFVIKIVPK